MARHMNKLTHLGVLKLKAHLDVPENLVPLAGLSFVDAAAHLAQTLGLPVSDNVVKVLKEEFKLGLGLLRLKKPEEVSQDGMQAAALAFIALTVRELQDRQLGMHYVGLDALAEGRKFNPNEASQMTAAAWRPHLPPVLPALPVLATPSH